MRYVSVCSGIEAATVAWHPLGWEPVAFAEIEPFPCALLAHHYPNVPNWGDMTKHKEWPDADVDVLVGGTPCQAFSVAGLRAGLADPRGNLTLTFLGIVEQYRPEWVVWENVPGVLSIDGGRTFGSFLGGLAELGYGFAYRVLDAQFFGVAQRRRRVFVVANATDWRRAAAVLFERDCLSGNPAPRRETGEGVAPSLAARTRGGGGLGTDAECDGALIAHALRADGFDASEDGTGRGTPLIPVAFALRGRDDGAVPEISGDAVNALRSASGGSSRDYVAFAQNQRDEVRTMDVAGALASEPGMKQQTYIAQAIAWDEEINASVEQSGTIIRGGDGGRHAGVMEASMAVRRLTPVECERLQGFPDDYTAVPYNKKPAKDGPRYKSLGNSMAVPVMRWIGERIAMVEELTNGQDHHGHAARSGDPADSDERRGAVRPQA